MYFKNSVRRVCVWSYDFFMTSCAASLTDYGYKGGSTWTMYYLDAGSFPDLGNQAGFSVENTFPEVKVVIKYPQSELYDVDCKWHDSPVKKIDYKNCVQFEAKNHMSYKFSMK